MPIITNGGNATIAVTGAIGAQSAANVAITGGNISITNVIGDTITNGTITGGTINNYRIGIK